MFHTLLKRPTGDPGELEDAHSVRGDYGTHLCNRQGRNTGSQSRSLALFLRPSFFLSFKQLSKLDVSCAQQGYQIRIKRLSFVLSFSR